MASEKVHERTRAVSTTLGLLKSAASNPHFHASPTFPRPGLLAGRLVACVGAPEVDVSSQALQGLHFLHSLMKRQAAPGTRMGWGKAEQQHGQEEKLDLPGCSEMRANFLELIKELGQLLTPDQLTDLILTVTGGLKEASESNMEASKAALTLILNKYKHGLQAQVVISRMCGKV
ncbi:maestro heat-like repeat-containing protein family member 7 [Dromaius novaehollandiae]|uniref:maestro heat-like repeat-containing protein family member 7 n=1 Tax=Dromaius novaehollandiae TaxID=8790 RepID=UPI00311F7C18